MTRFLDQWPPGSAARDAWPRPHHPRHPTTPPPSGPRHHHPQHKPRHDDPHPVSRTTDAGHRRRADRCRQDRITEMVKGSLGRLGRYINVNMDFCNPLHPSYHRWRADNEATASAKVRPDGQKWWNKAQLYTIENLATRRPRARDARPQRVRRHCPPFSRRWLPDRDRRARPAWRPQPTGNPGPLRSRSAGGRPRASDAPSVDDECYDGVVRGARVGDTGQRADMAFAFQPPSVAVYARLRCAALACQWRSGRGCLLPAQRHDGRGGLGGAVGEFGQDVGVGGGGEVGVGVA
jgi:Zeta toxin